MSSNFDADQDFIRQAMPAFISEAAEQIEALETLLLELEESERSLMRCVLLPVSHRACAPRWMTWRCCA